MRTGRFIARGLAAWLSFVLLQATAQAQAPALRKVQVGAAVSWFTPEVSAEDVKWRPPAPDGMKNAPIFGYAHRWKPGQPIPNSERVQLPLYRNFDSDDPKWWDEQLDEVLFTRPAFIFLIARACSKPEDTASFAGPGGMCPYKLRMMADAVRRAAAEDAARFALFLDTGATFVLRSNFTRNGPERLDQVQSDKSDLARFDLSDIPDSSGRPALWYFWDAAIRPWFDTVPRAQWYLFDDRGVKKPVIAFWSITHRFVGHRGNTAKLLRDIKAKFVERYGVEPFFLLSTGWIADDPGLANDTTLAGGVHGWFNTRYGVPQGAGSVIRWRNEKWLTEGTPNGISSLTEWNSAKWGVTVPGFGCGTGCRIAPVDRQGGRSFELALEANRSATINMIEGFNGPLENTAVFRSEEQGWEDVNQYLKILRRFSDPSTRSTRLQAEGADDIKSMPPTPGQPLFRSGYDIREISDRAETGAWELQTTSRGQGFRYRRLYFEEGTYKFILRGRSREMMSTIDLAINGKVMATESIPYVKDTSDRVIFQISILKLMRGYYDVDIISGDKPASIDWLIINRL